MSVVRKTTATEETEIGTLESVGDPTKETVIPIKSEEQIRSEVAAEYEARFAALEARIANATAPTVVNQNIAAPKPNNHLLGFDPNTAPDKIENGVLIHFLEDGYTIGANVFYRGQETLIAEEDLLDRRTQLRKYKKQFYAVGPWDGEGYDLEDPNLTDADRERLLALQK